VRTVIDVLFGVSGQSIYFDAPEGRPSSVTSVEVFSWASSDDVAELAGSGSVETNPNTTLDGAAGPSVANPRNLPLTATTGIAVGRTYLVTGAASLKEWVEVESITSADSITAKHPLHNDYASGATFVSTRMTTSIDNTWAADETNIDETSGPNPMYRVRWVYVVSGTTYVADTYFNLIRYGARHGVTPQDVEADYAGWMDKLPVDHRNDQGRRLIEEAYRAVKIDLHAIEIDDATVAEAEIMDELVRCRVIERFEWAQFLSNRSADQSRHLAARGYYQERLDSLVRLASKVPIRDSTGAATRVTALGLSVR
jgi:hypothetical protein